jgi:ParB/RepB/Spo0J family partition protein
MLSLPERAKRALSKRTPISVPVSEIRRYENQPRKHFDEDRIRQLASAIDSAGQAVPGIVHAVEGAVPYELIDGERRWRAFHLIPEDRRPLYKADLIEADGEVIQFLVSGMANLNRVGHTPMEMAGAIEAYLGFGMKMPEIASVLGISEVWGYQIHGLTKLDEGVAEMLSPNRPRQEQLPVTAAIQIAKIEKSLQMGIALQVMEKKIPLGSVRKAVMTTAERAGVAVRTREVDPRKQWSALKSQLNKARRALQDAQGRAESTGVTKYFAGAGTEQSEFAKEIRAIEESVKELYRRLL